MGEALLAAGSIVGGMLLFTFREQIAATFKHGNEAVYRRLPPTVSDPLLRHSDALHGWMAFAIAMGGLLWTIVGVGALVYVLMGL